MLGKEILEFVECLELARDGDGVLDRLREALSPLGIEFFCLNLFPRPDQKFEEVMLASRVPAEWLALYLQEGYCHVDPAIRQCKYVVTPFHYLDAVYDPQIEPRAAEVVRGASEFGLADGVLVPVSAATGCIGNVWMGGPKLKPPREYFPIIHLIGLYAFYRLQGLCHSSEMPKPRLSFREKEILTWIAAGKSYWEIGEILKISRRTVEWHIYEACKKLGARTRAQAVSIAVRDRLINV
jgi:DNA-binding CsgD family transcriptional regulator